MVLTQEVRRDRELAGLHDRLEAFVLIQSIFASYCRGESAKLKSRSARAQLPGAGLQHEQGAQPRCIGSAYQLRAITFDLLLRRRLRADWALARSSTDALNIDRVIARLTGVLHITAELYRFSHVLRQLRRIGVRRNIQLVDDASFVRDREVRSAAPPLKLSARK